MSTTQASNDIAPVASPTARRTITSATSYEVQVDDGFAGEAERLLARLPSR